MMMMIYIDAIRVLPLKGALNLDALISITHSFLGAGTDSTINGRRRAMATTQQQQEQQQQQQQQGGAHEEGFHSPFQQFVAKLPTGWDSIDVGRLFLGGRAYSLHAEHGKMAELSLLPRASQQQQQ